MSSPTLSFDTAAARVQGRLLIRRWLRLLTCTSGVMAAAMTVILILRWLATAGPWLPMTAILVWLGGTAYWAWRSRPGRYEALACWDQTQRRNEAFAAAWWFELLPNRTPAEQRHWELQRPALLEALPQLTRDLPLALSTRLLWVPTVFLAALFVANLRPAEEGDAPLDNAMRQAARTEGERLARTPWNEKNLASLTTEEKKALEKLREQVSGTAKDLAGGSADSTREVLSDLEKRARDAEKLAERLGNDQGAWASDAMIAELRRHADTADLGDAAADKNAGRTAQAADDLAADLQATQLASSTQKRMTETLREVRRQAVPEDTKRTLGSHVLAAEKELGIPRVTGAAEEFKTLAEKMRDLSQREQARKEMENLAQQLRAASSRIAGQEGGGIQSVPPAGDQKSTTQQTPQIAAGSRSENEVPQTLQPPGLSQQPQQSMLTQPPNQATSQGQQQQVTIAQGQIQPGQDGQEGKLDPNKPMLLAPIPGAKPDEQPSVMLMAPNLPQDASTASAMAALGGKQAGTGTAKLNSAQSGQTKAKQSSVVTTKSGTDGTSSVRSIDGGIKQESTSRSGEDLAVEFIAAEEAALNEAGLPLQRREQVRRYLTELRKRFEPKP